METIKKEENVINYMTSHLTCYIFKRTTSPILNKPLQRRECYQLSVSASDMLYFKNTTGPVLSKPLQRLECYQLSDTIYCVWYLKRATGPVKHYGDESATNYQTPHPMLYFKITTGSVLSSPLRRYRGPLLSNPLQK